LFPSYTFSLLFRVAASVTLERQEAAAEHSSTSTIHATASYCFPRASISFDLNRIKLDDEFVTDIRNALSKPSDADKQNALQNEFRKYGHVFAAEVDLGAMLMTTDTKVVTSKVILGLHSQLCIYIHHMKTGSASSSCSIPESIFNISYGAICPSRRFCWQRVIEFGVGRGNR
jgi:hypothetical protein